jgi:hypothetical protein
MRKHRRVEKLTVPVTSGPGKTMVTGNTDARKIQRGQPDRPRPEASKTGMAAGLEFRFEVCCGSSALFLFSMDEILSILR